LPYASGFFFIQKKDGKLWPVQDYHNLNKWTVPNKYPLPLIPDLIHSIAGKMLFMKFDVQWGYNNIPIKPGDEWKAAFKTSEGLFEPMVMFFGLTNSPATFQMMMDDIFQEEIAQGWVKIYMDDIIITTKDDKEEHTCQVNQVLKKLEEHDLYLKPEKCNFHVKEVEYLGVIIGQGQVKMDLTKVKGIAEWPVPTSVKDVWSFLGFCNFYQVFIPHFSDKSQPLNDLTCKNHQWEWTEREQQAFQSLKDACATLPALRCPDWSKRFILKTDTLGYALGAIISQEFDDGIYPIAFHSQSLLPAKKNYDTHDKKLAAVLFGFKCGRPLFLGAAHPVEVCTDHKNLQYFCQPQKITG
jgi:RNase H-like domain found in reverse transcriptase/Reverse transcriptase (RNA-dependent DNA polymerase)